MGAVWGPGQGHFDAARLRPVARLIDAQPLTPGMIEFLDRAADYTAGVETFADVASRLRCSSSRSTIPEDCTQPSATVRPRSSKFYLPGRRLSSMAPRWSSRWGSLQ